ncbi:serine/threonine protein kinase [Sphingobacterium zeae]|uniref:Serine/threonine protein kinase n=1 Tax=Sphingobacterium zeae TaxID=1776859 RepID=A0ABU0UBZ0_9SPHI|nr:serine/threonine-protein kinase [Sphingobacterium zeae]MDQ1152373.1 serine/threonine protein kinase [Sphingobacterium zeae]
MALGQYTTNLSFELKKEIGQEGRNSQVFIAHDNQFDEQIVIKRINKLDFTDEKEFYRETKILFASAHANVVKIFYGCSDDQYVYLAMPLYEKGSLKSLCEHEHLSIRDIIRYSIQFLSGLHNIHSKGLIHFDVKPDNVLISNSNEAHLSDFGLAKAMNILGHANPDSAYSKHIPPEFYEMADKTYHYDIYSAGVTLYRLLNGEKIFNDQFYSYKTSEERQNAIESGKFPDRTKYLPHIPQKLRGFVNKAMSVNIEDRHDSVLSLLNDLGSVEDNLDWIYTENNKILTWKRISDKYLYKIEVNLGNTNNISMFTTRTDIKKDKTVKQKSYCHNNLTKSNVLSKIKHALKL